MFEHKNTYPVILVPGVAGYGEETLLGKILPYFGMTAANVEKIIKSMGMDCHTPTLGLLSGVWDRTCELYAQIVGGTVDYGEAHSQKYGHSRYGKTYENAMVPNWGELDAEGNPVKITLIAHGFGVPVARLLVHLLSHGSDFEKNSASDNLSPLFVGGKDNLIHCIVSMAGVNEGITLIQALEDKVPGAQKLMVKAAVALKEVSLYSDFVDPYYQRHGLTVTQHNLSAHFVKPENEDEKIKVEFDESAIDRYLSKKRDNLLYDLSITGMNSLNDFVSPSENTYYLSMTGSVTANIMDKVNIPRLSSGITAPFALLISTFENYLPEYPIVTKKYQENDGLVNTHSSLPPENEGATAYRSPDRCTTGIWYQMPIQKRNHLSFRGLFNRPDKYRNEIYDLMKIICNLETV